MVKSLDELDALLAQAEDGGPAPDPLASAPAAAQPQAPAPAPQDALRAMGQSDPARRTSAPAGARSLDELDTMLQAKDAAESGDGSILRGFNSSLANLIGFPVEVVNEAMGLAGANFAKGGEPSKAIRQAFSSLGIRTHEPGKGDIWDRIGSETLSGVLSMVGLRAAAPAMQAAAQAPQAGSVARAGGVLADAAIRRPVNTAVGTLAAPLGAVPGAEFVGSTFEKGGEALAGGKGVVSQAARATGEVIGGTLGGIGVGGPAQIAGDIAGNAGKALARTVVGNRPGLAPTRRADLPEHSTPIADDAADPANPTYFAQNAVTRELQATDNAIRREVQAIQAAASRGLSEGEVSTRLADAIDRVYDNGRALERRLWGRIPSNTRVSQTNEIDNALNDILQYADTDAPRIPWRGVTNLTDLLEANRDGTRRLTTGDLLTVRSRLLKEAREAHRGTLSTPADPTLAANLERLEQGVLAVIHRTLPNNTAVAQARAYSLAFNDRFTRGPIGQVRLRDGQNELKTRPEDVLRALLEEPRGPQALYNATGPMPVGGRSGTQVQTLAGSGPARTVMDEGIRAAYANDLADVILKADQSADPSRMARGVASAASAANRKLNGRIDDYARASTTLRDSQTQFLEWANERDVWANSALAQFAQKSPQAAVASIMNSANPAAAVRELMRGSTLPAAAGSRGRMRMDSDPQAVEGLKRGVISHIFQDHKAEPLSLNRIQNTLNSPKVRDMLGELFTVEERARLDRIMKAATELSSGNISMGARGARLVGTGLAHLLGLKFGAGIANLTSAGAAGSLSIPARTAAQARKLFLGAFASGDPAKLIASAVMDPQMERLLLMKAPSTLKDLRRANAISRKLVAGAAGARVGMEKALHEMSGQEDEE